MKVILTSQATDMQNAQLIYSHQIEEASLLRPAVT